MRNAKALLYVSAVTIQELAVVGQMRGDWAEMRDWLRERFNPLPFTPLCAEKAASLQVGLAAAEPSAPKVPAAKSDK
jgi:hypothetical protein